MGGWFTYLLLLIWAFLALVGGPSHEEIQRSCEGHGRVVGFDSGGFFDFGKPMVICSDGTVRKVD